MNQDYIKPDNWSIIEEGFDAERVKSSESLFSIGNGAMGQQQILKKITRRNFSQLQEYIIQTKPKWAGGKWISKIFCKSFKRAKWIGIDIEINDILSDLNVQC
jgi:maltose phosphorylase